MIEEIGSWTTAEGTVPATLDFESLDADAQELPAWVKSAAAGALSGALAGSAAGPYGALVGGVAGGALGAAGSLSKPAPAPTPPPVATTPPPPPPAGAQPPAPTPSPSPPPVATAPPAGGANSAAVATALQQLAAIMPVLLQAVAPSGATAPKSGGESFEVAAEIGIDLETLEPSEWEFASLEGEWTLS